MSDPRLQSFVERYERLADERKTISSDMGDVLSEADGAGYDKAAVRRLVAWRAMDAADRQEREITDEIYRAALSGGPKPNLDGVKPVDPLLQRAIALYRTGATVREVQGALKAEGHKVSVGTAHKLKRRAKPFLDAEKEAAAKAARPVATVHVHPRVNMNAPHNPVTGELIDGETGEASQDASLATSDCGLTAATAPLGNPEREARSPTTIPAAVVPAAPASEGGESEIDLTLPRFLDRRIAGEAGR